MKRLIGQQKRLSCYMVSGGKWYVCVPYVYVPCAPYVSTYGGR